MATPRVWAMIEIETVEEVDGWELGRDADALPNGSTVAIRALSHPPRR